MGPSIREDQWQAMLRIASEVADLPQDPAVRRRHLAAALCELLRGSAAHSFEFRPSQDGAVGYFDTQVSVGLDPLQLHQMRRRFEDDESADAVVPHLLQDRSAQFAHQIYSRITLSDGTGLGVGVHRSPHDKPFTQHDCELLNAFHLHTWRLYGRSMKCQKLDPVLESLPRRLRPVLHELLSTGDSEKQIAARLKLSRHTVHEYVKSLYQRLGVGSRAELMNRFSAGASKPTPEQSKRMWLAS